MANAPEDHALLQYDETYGVWFCRVVPQIDEIDEATADHGVDIDGWHIKDGGTDGTFTGAANTFNITKGTASLDVAAGAAVNVDANLTVEAASVINQDVSSDAQPTFAQLAGLGAPDANGEAIRQTAKITEALLESATDLKHAAVTLATDHGLSLSTQQLAMGTPSTITAATTNAVTTTTHSHAITGFSETSHNHNLSGLTSHNHSDLDNIGANDHHNAVTVSAPIVLTGQAIELKNNAGSPAQVTAIDVGTIANSDTVVPTSKAVYTGLAAKLNITSLVLPFYTAAGVLDTIPLTADQKLPFYVAAGTASNIPLTT